MDKLSEQQRVLVAVVLSVAILFGWQFLFPPKPPATPPAGTEKELSSDESTADSDAGSATDAPIESPADGAAGDTDSNGTAQGSDGTEGPDAGAARSADSGGDKTADAGDENADGVDVAGDAATDLAQEPDEPPPAPKVVAATRTFSTGPLRGTIANVNGAFQRLELVDYSEHASEDAEEATPVILVADEGPAYGRQGLLDFQFDGAAAAPPLDFAEADGISLAGANAAMETRVDIDPIADSFALAYRVNLRNLASTPLKGKLVVRMGLRQEGEGRSMFAPAADVVSGLCYYGGGVDRDLVTSLEEDEVDTSENVLWSGIDRQYFVVAAVPTRETSGVGCTMAGQDATALVSLELPIESVAPGAQWQQEFTVFAGPKRNDALEAVDPTLSEAIEYNLWGIPLGAIARPMVYLLNVFHGWAGNWGVAIIGLTLLVKLGLFPVTYRSAVSMRKMQKLRPEIERLKKQYENDRERQQLEQMKLFREQGVNPLGGCLPLLLQMPIWFALYRTLWTSVDLYQQPFLWISDLTAAEPFPFLAIAVGGLTFLQQRLQPMALDNQQMKVMMYVMPVMFTFFMFALPSGLVLYILVNSALTIVQQLVINREK